MSTLIGIGAHVYSNPVIVVNDTPPAGGPTGEGILLENGSDFLLAENDDYLIQE